MRDKDRSPVPNNPITSNAVRRKIKEFPLADLKFGKHVSYFYSYKHEKLAFSMLSKHSLRGNDKIGAPWQLILVIKLMKIGIHYQEIA